MLNLYEPSLKILCAMNCKNCTHPLVAVDLFCAHCGAKVVTEPLQIKSLWLNFSDEVLGWDNRFFRTIKALVLRPQVLITEYLSGTRKKYLSPFLFLSIGLAFSTFLFSMFSDQFVELNSGGIYKELAINDAQIAINQNISKIVLKLFNLIIYLVIPIYALISSIVFRKPHTYAEHLIINCYVQGITFLGSGIIFVVALQTNLWVYYLSNIMVIAYYLYVYSKLYQLKALQIVLKALKFFGVALLFSLGIGVFMAIVGVGVGIIIAMLRSS